MKLRHLCHLLFDIGVEANLTPQICDTLANSPGAVSRLMRIILDAYKEGCNDKDSIREELLQELRTGAKILKENPDLTEGSRILNKIQAIKIYRERVNCELREAKEAIDMLADFMRDED